VQSRWRREREGWMVARALWVGKPLHAAQTVLRVHLEVDWELAEWQNSEGCHQQC